MIVRFTSETEKFAQKLSLMRQAFWNDQITKGLREIAPDCSLLETLKLANRARSICYLGVADEQVTGYVLGQIRVLPGLPIRSIGSIEEIMVDRSSRRDGLGRNLVEVTLNGLRAEGAQRLQLRVLSGNEEGSRFWERCGFRPYLTTLEKGFEE